MPYVYPPQALIRLASEPALTPTTSTTASPTATALAADAAGRLQRGWPGLAAGLLLAPSLEPGSAAAAANAAALFTSQPYECEFRDYTPSLFAGGGGGGFGGGGGAGGGGSLSLRTPAFMMSQVRDGWDSFQATGWCGAWLLPGLIPACSTCVNALDVQSTQHGLEFERTRTLLQDASQGGGYFRGRQRPPRGLLRATASVSFNPTVSLSLTGAGGGPFAAPLGGGGGGGGGASQASGGGAAFLGPSLAAAAQGGGGSQQGLAGASQQHGYSLGADGSSGGGTSGGDVVRLVARSRAYVGGGNGGAGDTKPGGGGANFAARLRGMRAHQARQLRMGSLRRHGRAARVSLLRSYRTGELPDTLSLRLGESFLRPLAALVEADATAATAALAALTAAVLEEGNTAAGSEAAAEAAADVPAAGAAEPAGSSGAAAAAGGDDGSLVILRQQQPQHASSAEQRRAAAERERAERRRAAQQRGLHAALAAGFGCRPTAPAFVAALQAVAARFAEAALQPASLNGTFPPPGQPATAGGADAAADSEAAAAGAVAAPPPPLLLLQPADVLAAAGACGGQQAAALLLETQQAALEERGRRLQEQQQQQQKKQQQQAAAAGGRSGGSSSSRAARAAANAVQAVQIGLHDTLEALAVAYGDLGESDVAAAARAGLLLCPVTAAALAAEAAGRPRLAVRRLGQAQAAAEMVQVRACKAQSRDVNARGSLRRTSLLTSTAVALTPGVGTSCAKAVASLPCRFPDPHLT